MWSSQMQQRTEGVSTELSLRSGAEEGATKHDQQTSAVLPHGPTAYSFVRHSQQPQQLVPVESPDAPPLDGGMKWDRIQTTVIAKPPRHSASQRLALKEQVLRAFDEAEDQLELNKRMVKSLNDAHNQYQRLKKIFRKGEERWMMEARTFQKRELEWQAKFSFLEKREQELQHQLSINQKVLKALRMHEAFAFTKTDAQIGATLGNAGSNCPQCTCPHCKKSIHDVVDLSDSEEDAAKRSEKPRIS
ncbi:hypothetical protein MPTK2_4g05620 [Marchantia polymorpha subsp. ruderalis]